MQRFEQHAMPGIKVFEGPTSQDLMPAKEICQRVASRPIVVKECVVEVAEKHRHRIIDAMRRV